MSPLTLRVYEHETIRPGARTRDGSVVPDNLDLDALARFCDTQAGPAYFRVGRNAVTFTEFVGYLQVGDVAIEVLPKADRGGRPGDSGRWRSALMTMLRVASGMQLHVPNEGSQRVDRRSLLDLVAATFLDQVDGLVREGLARTYRTHEANSAVFRGRLVVSEHLRQNVVRPDRVYVRFATFDADSPLNQVLAEALRVVADLGLSEGLHARAVQHLPLFEDFARLRVTSKTFDRIALGRSTVRYEKALLLARLILEGVAPALTYGRHRVIAFLFDMNVLWETFVATLFRRAAVPGITVRTQESATFWACRGGASRRLRPDIVVRAEPAHDVLLVVDTKWKVLDNGVPSDDDLKQMFAYNELFKCRDAVLLYPAPGTDRREAVKGGFAVGTRHVCRTGYLGLFDGDRVGVLAIQAQVSDLLRATIAASDGNANALPWCR